MYAIAVLMFCDKRRSKALTCCSLGEKCFSPLHQSRKYVHTRVKAPQGPRSPITAVETLR